MLSDKLIAIPIIPNGLTRKKEKTNNKIKFKMEIKVLILIIPTAESKLPYRFRRSIFNENPPKKIRKTTRLFTYFASKKKDKIPVENINPIKKIINDIGINNL